MAAKFDIIDYLSGLTGFIFDKSVLTRVATERMVLDVDEYSQLDTKTKDLLLVKGEIYGILCPNEIA